MERALAVLMALGIHVVFPVMLGFVMVGVLILLSRPARKESARGRPSP